MSTITRVANNFTSNDFSALNTLLDQADSLLTHAKGLSARDKSRLVRLGPKNMEFVESAERALDGVPDLRPAFVDPSDFAKDLMLVRQVDALIMKLRELLSKLEDSQLLAGDVVFHQSLAIWRTVQSAYNIGYPAAKPHYDDLNKRWEDLRFSRTGSNDEPQMETPVDPDANPGNSQGGDGQMSQAA